MKIRIPKQIGKIKTKSEIKVENPKLKKIKLTKTTYFRPNLKAFVTLSGSCRIFCQEKK